MSEISSSNGGNESSEERTVIEIILRERLRHATNALETEIEAEERAADENSDGMNVEGDVVGGTEEMEREDGRRTCVAGSSRNHERMQLRSQTNGQNDKQATMYEDVANEDDDILDLYYNPLQDENEEMESGDDGATHQQDIPRTAAPLVEGNASPRKAVDLLGISCRDKVSIEVTKLRMKKLKGIEANRRTTLLGVFRNCIMKVANLLLLLDQCF